MPSQPLLRAAEAAVRCLAVGPHDSLLVLCNPETRATASALVEAAQVAARTVQLAEFPTMSRNGEEPPDAVGRAMLGASAIIASTTYSLSHTTARAAATERGARIATMAGVDEETFCRSIAVDYAQLQRDGDLLATALTTALTCRVTAASGTDVRLCLGNRNGISDDGALQT